MTQIMDESFSTGSFINQKIQKTKKQSSKDKIERQGRWDSEENLKYVIFISYNLTKFQCKKKRMFRLYKPLSKFIITRNSEQCRSHHRKLLQRFNTPKNILINLEKQFGKGEIQSLREESLSKLMKFSIPQKKSLKNEKQEIKCGRIEQNKLQKKLSKCSNISEKTVQTVEDKETADDIKIGNAYLAQSPFNLEIPQVELVMSYPALNMLNNMYQWTYNCFHSNVYNNFYNPFQTLDLNNRDF